MEAEALNRKAEAGRDFGNGQEKKLEENFPQASPRKDQSTDIAAKAFDVSGSSVSIAKAMVRHGEWESFLEDNFKASRSAAFNYVAVAKDHALLVVANVQGLGLLTSMEGVSAAAKQLGKPDPGPGASKYMDAASRYVATAKDHALLVVAKVSGLTLLTSMEGVAEEQPQGGDRKSEESKHHSDVLKTSERFATRW